MPTFNLFSKRQQALREEPSDILTYDSLPSALRVQLVHIISDCFDQGTYHITGISIYTDIVDALCREYGLFVLNRNSQFGKDKELKEFILSESNVEKVLDAVELSMKYLDVLLRKDATFNKNVDSYIEELNGRFKQHAIGFQYEGGDIIKIDSTYIHTQVVKPVIKLLYNTAFTGANEEYMKAHEHYRHGKNKECLTECLKAFESTLKIIFTSKGWAFSPTATASALINVALANNLIPVFLQTQLTSLRSVLESGVPTLRNKLGGHGQGASPTVVDDETARYTLNLTGSNIIYLIELSKV